MNELERAGIEIVNIIEDNRSPEADQASHAATTGGALKTGGSIVEFRQPDDMPVRQRGKKG
jgi:hypothetical protein